MSGSIRVQLSGLSVLEARLWRALRLDLALPVSELPAAPVLPVLLMPLASELVALGSSAPGLSLAAAALPLPVAAALGPALALSSPLASSLPAAVLRASAWLVGELPVAVLRSA